MLRLIVDGMDGDTRAVVEAVGVCFNSHNFDGLDDFVAEDMRNLAAGPQGREGWKAVWGAIVSCFPDVVAETKAIIVDGDQAAVHTVMVGTHRASVMPLLDGIVPTGAHVAWEFVHLFKVDGGLIVEHSAVRDDLGLLKQLASNPDSPTSTEKFPPLSR